MKYLLSVVLNLLIIQGQAQTVEMADQFRADGKIYVVIAVILVILIGLFIYLFRLDRKTKNLEEELIKK